MDAYAQRLSRRPASASDEPFARQTHHAAYHDVVVAQFGAWDKALQDAFFDRGWYPADHEILLMDGQPCGYLKIRELSEVIHLDKLVIDPRFQNQGVGTAVLRQLKARAAAKGVPLRLQTHLQNRALGLYEREGFRRYGETATHVLMEWDGT